MVCRVGLLGRGIGERGRKGERGLGLTGAAAGDESYEALDGEKAFYVDGRCHWVWVLVLDFHVERCRKVF
jgi:hypothetical protein